MSVNVSDAFVQGMIADHVVQTVRIDLLDAHENPIDRIETDVDDGSISADAERDVVRQMSLNLANESGIYTWGIGSKIWIDKKIAAYIGVKTPAGAMEFAPAGVYLLREPRASSSQVAQISGSDKWSLFDGSPRGKLDQTYVIPVNTPVTTAIQTMAGVAGETKFNFDPCDVKTPYTLTYHPGEAIGKAMKDLAKMVVYDLYYDARGWLTFRPSLQDLTTVQLSWRYDISRFSLYDGSERVLDDKEFFNRVLVLGGSSSTSTVSAVASNDDPNHPLSTVNVGIRLYSHNNGSPDSLITTKDLAQARADYELRKRMRVMDRQNFKADPNYTHEPLDVIEIVDPYIATNYKYQLMRFNIPLGATGQMTGEAVRIT